MRQSGIQPRFFRGLDFGSGPMGLANNGKLVPHRMAESEQFSDNHDVTLAKGMEHQPELQPVTLCTADLLFIDSFAPILPQLVALPVQILVLGGDPGVSNSHHLSFKG